MKRRVNAVTVATLAMLVAVAMLLSYIEHLIPSPVPIPGVKIGLANIATVFALYVLGRRYAVVVTVLRVALSSLLFGNPVGLLYAISGAALALVGMCALKGVPIFSAVGVSVIGGVLHNTGQVIAAAFVLETAGLMITYLPLLLVFGTIAGVLVGVASGLLVRRIGNKLNIK